MSAALTKSILETEAGEAPEAVAVALARNAGPVARLAGRLRSAPPPFIATCARGSSGAAAAWLKHAVETSSGLPVVDLWPSTVALNRAPLHLQDALVVFVSQSGASPDLLATAARARAAGALTVGLVNDEGSPLARSVDMLLPLSAGPERSVAATKSCLAAVAVGLQLASALAGDAAGVSAVHRLPAALRAALGLDWSAAVPALVRARSAYCIGRGAGYALAIEAALKLKETCGIHAEAFSAAEVRHGPLALAGPELPVLLFGQDDPTQGSLVEVEAVLRSRGSPTIAAGLIGGGVVTLSPVADGPPAEAPAQLLAFYHLIAALARARGRNPDAPPGLRKVTLTM